MRLQTVQGLSVSLNGTRPVLLSPVTARELAVTHQEPTAFGANTATAQQTENRNHVVKIIGAAALLWLGFMLLDRKGG